jgi:hypothetical protein
MPRIMVGSGLLPSARAAVPWWLKLSGLTVVISMFAKTLAT